MVVRRSKRSREKVGPEEEMLLDLAVATSDERSRTKVDVTVW